LKAEQDIITKNITNLLPYPDLLKSQNEKLQELKTDIKLFKIKEKKYSEKF